MRKDSLDRKTCFCGKFYYDEAKGCWCNQHGGEVRKGKDFYCPDCGRLLKPNGKQQAMKDDDSSPEE